MADARPSECRIACFKENMVILVRSPLQEVQAVDILKAVIAVVGHGNLLALRPRPGSDFELTLADRKSTEALLDGVEINGEFCTVKPLGNSDKVISFLHLPAYITYEDILDKLQGWGVVALQPVRRRFYPGTDITDGTRYVKVRFPRESMSLPYSSSFMTAEGLRYLRVIHDGQVKTCRLCMSPEHLMKDCPTFICRECCEQGHYARDCTAARCPVCQRALISCVCRDGSEEEEPRDDLEEEQGCQETGRDRAKRKMVDEEDSPPTDTAIRDEDSGPQMDDDNNGGAGHG